MVRPPKIFLPASLQLPQGASLYLAKKFFNPDSPPIAFSFSAFSGANFFYKKELSSAFVTKLRKKHKTNVMI